MTWVHVGTLGVAGTGAATIRDAGHQLTVVLGGDEAAPEAVVAHGFAMTLTGAEQFPTPTEAWAVAISGVTETSKVLTEAHQFGVGGTEALPALGDAGSLTAAVGSDEALAAAQDAASVAVDATAAEAAPVVEHVDDVDVDVVLEENLVAAYAVDHLLAAATGHDEAAPGYAEGEAALAIAAVEAAPAMTATRHLTPKVGTTTATQTAGTGSYTNPTQAQGLPEGTGAAGTYAELLSAQGALGAAGTTRSATLTGQFAALTLPAVGNVTLTLRVASQRSGDVANLNVVLAWSLDGTTWTSFRTLGTAAAANGTPEVTGVWSEYSTVVPVAPADLGNLRWRLTGSVRGGASAPSWVRVDAGTVSWDTAPGDG